MKKTNPKPNPEDRKNQEAKGSPGAQDFRQKAEEILAMQPEILQKIPAEDIKALIHELGVHQIELEMQNDELRRKQVELEEKRIELEISSNRYIDLYDFAPVGYFTLDRQGLIVEVNLPGARLFGLERAGLIGKPFNQFVARDSQDAFYLHSRQVLAVKANQTCELTIKNSSGRKFPAELHSIAAADEQGHFTRFRTAVSDITARKQAEAELERQRRHLSQTVAELQKTTEALRESEAKYSTLVNRALDGVMLVQDGICRFANEALAAMVGSTAGEITGKPFLDLVAPGSRDLVAERYSKRITGEEDIPSFYETKFLHKDGDIREVEMSVGLIRYQGELATMAVVRDITERKRTEEELRKMQKLESLGVLAAGIAHDFRNLLTAVIGGLSLARLYVRGDDGKLSEILDTIDKGSQKAKDLSEQLLTFARGGAPIKKITSFQELLKSTAGFTLKGANSRCELILPEDLWPVEIDPGQISQVLSNLIINADQAMPGGGTIRIEAENVTIGREEGIPLAGGDYIRVSVKDEGVGIPKEHLGNIFDPYFTTKKGGSGLGLATVYSIIKRHEGYLTVDSEVGGGTTLSFYLPAVPSAAVEEAGEGIWPGVEEIRGKILVMEDEGIVRNTFAEMLRHLGFESALAVSSDEAVRLYAQALESGQPFRAVILDLIIQGGWGGLETLNRLQEIDPGVKAIVTSGYSNDPILSNYEHYGFKAALPKPFELKNMAWALQAVAEA